MRDFDFGERGPAGNCGVNVSEQDVAFQHLIVKSKRGQRTDANFETVRRRHSIVSVVLHVPEMAELMIGAGRRTAGAERLHGETGHHQAVNQVPERGGIARRNCSGAESQARKRPCTAFQVRW